MSLGEVATKAGVSISTVSRIVNGETRRASPETLARVQAAIKAVGYHPNQLGRALRDGRSFKSVLGNGRYRIVSPSPMRQFLRVLVTHWVAAPKFGESPQLCLCEPCLTSKVSGSSYVTYEPVL